MAKTVNDRIAAPIVTKITQAAGYFALPLLCLLLALPSPAHAQESTCLTHDAWRTFLMGEFRGELVGTGKTALKRPAGAATVELWIAADGKWVLLLDYPEGISCIFGAGMGWGAPGVPL